ncbi:Inner membrane protein ydgK [Shigella sonnei]|nr:Inner membrane protein ydgK [Shigella sonnei]
MTVQDYLLKFRKISSLESRPPKHYIIWLLISVLLAVKAFAFSPVEDGIAVRQLLFTLLATALIVPYFKRSSRVKATFVNP